jgi:hypothetical protein
LPPRHPLEEKARQSVRRLIDLLQAAVLHSPHVIIAIEQTARAFVAEERRRDLKHRLTYLDAKELAAIDALISQFERQRDESSEPTEEDAT